MPDKGNDAPSTPDVNAPGDGPAAGDVEPMADGTASSDEATASDPGAETAASDDGPTKAAKSQAPTERTVTRRQVTSKRVTPKGGGPATASGPKKAGSASADDEPVFSKRYTPPSQGAYGQAPSPMWVPILMFALLILGAAVIIANYAGVFGDAANIRLVIGLALILGGIITATQYR
jgi:hypothetical protein